MKNSRIIVGAIFCCVFGYVGPAHSQALMLFGPAEAEKSRVIASPEKEPLILPSAGMKIAVMRFEVTGIEPTLGDGVAEMVAGKVSNNRGFIVVERAAIDTVLREMEIQRSGLTTEDAVKIGRGVNARKVLLGSIRKFGQSFVMTARVVDVETQQVEGSRNVQCEECSEKDLPLATDTLSALILGTKLPSGVSRSRVSGGERRK